LPVFALVTNAERVSVVVPGVEELMTTGVTENEYIAFSVLLVVVAVKATLPTKPFTGVTVKTVPAAVAPAAAVAVAVAGVRVKSATVAEVTSTLTEAFDPA
jgi:hypothetical protein